MNEMIIFISWNVRGLGKIAKLKQVIYRLKQLKASIVFLQEAHLLLCPPLSVFEEMATSDPYSKGKISIIYKKLVNITTESSNYKRLAWIEDLQTDITEH